MLMRKEIGEQLKAIEGLAYKAEIMKINMR